MSVLFAFALLILPPTVPVYVLPVPTIGYDWADYRDRTCDVLVLPGSNIVRCGAWMPTTVALRLPMPAVARIDAVGYGEWRFR